jgi:predicted nucleic acid-binding protein
VKVDPFIEAEKVAGHNVAIYLDSSALVKLVQRETEAEALRRFLRKHRDDQLATSTLARVEVVRAVLAGGPIAIASARRQVSRIDQISLETELLDRAATPTTGVLLRSSDAIHLSSAQVIGAELRAIVTYDERMALVASSLGIVVEAPS